MPGRKRSLSVRLTALKTKVRDLEEQAEAREALEKAKAVFKRRRRRR